MPKGIVCGEHDVSMRDDGKVATLQCISISDSIMEIWLISILYLDDVAPRLKSYRTYSDSVVRRWLVYMTYLNSMVRRWLVYTTYLDSMVRRWLAYTTYLDSVVGRWLAYTTSSHISALTTVYKHTI